MGMLRNLATDKYDRQYSDAYLFRRLGNYFNDQLGRLAFVTAMSLGLSLIVAIVPIIIADAVDALDKNRDNRLTLLVVALSGASLFQYFGNWVRRRLTSRMIAEMTARMRKDAFAAAVERDMAFYDENKTGKIVSRVTTDTEEFGQVLVITTDVLSQLVQVVFLSIYLFYHDVLLTVIMFATLVPVLLATQRLRDWARRVTRQGSRAMAAVNDNIQETVTGISVAKNFRQEAAIYTEFERINTQSYVINLRRGMVLGMVFPILNGMGGLTMASVVYGGAVAVVNGSLSVGVWYLYVQAVDRFGFSLTNISSYWSQFQQAMSALERIFALIDAENTVKQIDQQAAPKLQGKITFKDTVFEYKSGVRVLDHFNLDIRAGENVAFVGHTGAGKSSIAKLIMRLYEFQGGSILIDGQDIRAFDLHSYRSQLGFVPQMPFLFSGTIADNIRYARPEATDAEIEQIAYSIGNGEWLETLPNGLQSDVGERGARLSIGQRQLVSLLRVLVQKPAIFILDEATASIDTFTEMQIQEAVEMILAQSTSILIAHRLSTVRSADRIIVLREGKIIEQGNHEALMVQGGHYAELYNTYFRHQSLDYVENSRRILAQA